MASARILRNLSTKRSSPFLNNNRQQIRQLNCQPSEATVGIVGLGNVGMTIAKNLSAANINKIAAFDCNLSTLDQIPSGKKCKSGKEVAAESDIVLTVLPTPKDVKSAMEGDDGILAGLKPGSIWVDHSTTDYEQTLNFAKQVESKGSQALEAPVTGGMALLKQGKMTALCGGPEEVFQLCKPIITQSCSNALYCGEIGTGTITKIITNMLAASHLVVAGEAVMMAKRCGIDLKSFFHGVRLSAGNSYVFETEVPLMFNGTYQPEFDIALHCKDLNIGYNIARKHGAPLPVHALVEQLYFSTMVKYGGKVGSSSPPRLLEDITGEKLQIPGYDNWTYTTEEVEGGSWGVVQTTKDKIDLK